MSAAQSTLFEAITIEPDQPTGELVAIVRARLRATLKLVQSSNEMPWTDHLTIIREDNAFRYDKDILPQAEAAALWDAFNVEMDRLYAGLNRGEE